MTDGLALADLDEWIADVTKDDALSHSITHTPHPWARAALGVLLGEEIPHRLWTSSELLVVLRRARIALTAASKETGAWRHVECGYVQEFSSGVQAGDRCEGCQHPTALWDWAVTEEVAR